MKNNANFALILFIIIPFLLEAQLDKNLGINSCFTDQLHNKMLSANKDYASKYQIIEDQIYTTKNQTSFSQTKKMTTQTIPVVIHIIHNNGPENISDGQVRDAIQHLNEAFANNGYFDPSTGVNVEIDFCLTLQDPENNESTGINRITSPLTNLTLETQDLELKSLLQWNPFDYLNIWVVNEITSVSSGPGVAGYAYLPAAHGMPEDGIVIEVSYFGSSQDNSKVLVHEAGHYLGLYHTFQGGCTNDNCQLNGDRVCDTPPDRSTAPVECGQTISTCNTDDNDTSANNPFRPIELGGLGDQNDMYINYMDYGYLPCYSAFTEGQKERMKTVLSTTRQSLLRSFSCQAPCPFLAYEASFSTNIPSPVQAGVEINFNNNSDSANFYEWSIDGEVFSNDFNSSYTFDQEGLFTVSLLIRDTINYCKSSFEQIVEVVCEGEASFSTESSETIAGVTTMKFINTSSTHNGFEWYLDGTLYSSETNIEISFTEPGYYSLYLVGKKATCLNYSSTITVDIGACSTPDYNREMHWYFGENAALDFNEGEPVYVSGSQSNSFEGTSCISDENGDLLFYTNGVSIWDATNTVMPNGSDLMGGMLTSARNQAIVVPRPFSQDQYYVFTCDEFENGGDNGVRYSIVDMNLNGGLGDITDVKNVFLCDADSEVMNAAYHADGQKAWFVVRSASRVLTTYLIDSTGIGPPINYSDASDIQGGSWGNGNFFNSGKRMLMTRYNDATPDFVILDFDNENGAFSNPKKFRSAVYEFRSIYSFALSEDDSKLYTVMWEDDNNYGLYQFDLSLTASHQISNSRTKIKQGGIFRKLLLAPNDKIYITQQQSQTLGVINLPNESVLDCDFVSDFIDISPGKNRISLPKFIKGKGFSKGINEPAINLGPDLILCDGSTTVLNPGGNENYKYLWQDGSTDPTYTAWQPGTYWVTVSNECGSATDYINIEFETALVDLGEDIISSTRSVTLDAGYTPDFYLWQDGSTNSTLTVTESGEYWVKVSTGEGCFQRDTINVLIEIRTNVYESSLIVYPNPSNGIFILEEETLDVLNDIEFTIYDPLGRKVLEQSVLLDGKMEIDLTNYPSGVYLLHWSTFDNSGTFKLLVQSI